MLFMAWGMCLGKMVLVYLLVMSYVVLEFWFLYLFQLIAHVLPEDGSALERLDCILDAGVL